MSYVGKALEVAEEETEDGRRTCSSTPLSSFQFLRSRLIRPSSADTATDFLQTSCQSSSQDVNRSRQAATLTNSVVNLGEEGEGQELSGTGDLSSFPQGLFQSSTPISHSLQSLPQQMNDTCDQIIAADSLVNKLAEEREELAEETSSTRLNSYFQLIQHRLIRPSCATHLTEGSLPQNNQGSSKRLTGSRCAADSHYPANLSVYEDCAKQMQSVKSIACGHMCRRRLFSKSINLDEACTSAVPRTAKRARIEDYVDTFLLSEVAQKIRFSCHKQEVFHSGGLLVQSNLVRDNGSFDWPSVDLQAMTTLTPTDCSSSMAGQQFLDDGQQFKQYPDAGHISRRALFHLDIKNQKQTCLMKDTSSQFSSCGWSLRDYDDLDQTYQDHDSTSITNSSATLHYTNIKGSTTSTPPDNFQSFDTMVNLFQT